MAVYFNIIIPIEKFLVDLKQLLVAHSITIYVEKFNEDRNFHYERIDLEKPNLNCFSDKSYRGFFFTSLNMAVQNGKLGFGENKTRQTDRISFYDDGIFDYCIEAKGGREDVENMECIKLRIISKNPDKQIDKFYKSLQTMFKKSTGIHKGLTIGKHFDAKIYYYKTDKNMLSDFTNKELKYIE